MCVDGLIANPLGTLQCIVREIRKDLNDLTVVVASANSDDVDQFATYVNQFELTGDDCCCEAPKLYSFKEVSDCGPLQFFNNYA